jgi:MoxR-like ATPase
VVPDDIKRLARPVLAHRILPRTARQGSTSDPGEDIISDILLQTPLPA